MSFSVVGGKTFICYECGHRVSVDYEGGAMMTQIGDLEVIRQQEIAEELNEQQIPDERGFYLYDFGLCASCYEKTISKSAKEQNNKLNELFRQLDVLYTSSTEDINISFTEALKQIRKNLTKGDISKAVGGLDDDILEDNRLHKGKRKSPMKSFIHTNSEELERYILKKVWKTDKIKMAAEQYKEASDKILDEMLKHLKKNKVYYLRKRVDASENLNEFIITDTSVRVPIEGSSSEAYYYEMEINFVAVRKSYRLKVSNLYLEKGILTLMVEKALEKKSDTN